MAIDLGGLLGTVAEAAIPALLGGNGNGNGARPGVQGTPVTAVPGGGMMVAGAPGVLNAIMDGASDRMIRGMARQARVGKTDLFNTLQALDTIAPGGRAFTPLEKVAISDQIEKIFKTRPRPAITKGLRRTVKQIKFLKKELRPIFK